jgi:phosphoenolpyruvate carboxylase
VEEPSITGKDEPLRSDIRLVGRVLGDVVREQAGQDVFDIVSLDCRSTRPSMSSARSAGSRSS